jgi:predicted secreted protein
MQYLKKQVSEDLFKVNDSRRIFQQKLWFMTKSITACYLTFKTLMVNRAFAQSASQNNIQQSLAIAQKNIQDKQKKVLSNDIVPDDRIGFGESSLEQSIFKITQNKSMPALSKLIDLSQTNTTMSDGRRANIIVQTTLPQVTKIAILFDKNPNLTTGIYQMASGVLPYLEIPIKMRESGKIYVLIQSQNRWFMQKKSIQVLLGGCG